MQSLDPARLRDGILEGLSSLPGSRKLHVVVLATTPRKYTGLFPHANPRPKTFVQDVVILLFEKEMKSASSSDATQRVCVAAVESFLYFLPSSSSAILYVSKVDSTGCGMHPSPVRALVRLYLAYMSSSQTRPAPNLWIHVFARSQKQYLFPNSSECTGKRVLDDKALCRWWKKVLEDVINDVETSEANASASASASASALDAVNGNFGPSHPSNISLTSEVRSLDCRAFVILPGQEQLDAERILYPGVPAGERPNSKWEYGHPYSSSTCPLPVSEQATYSLANLIPTFPDDPKARFLSEIASTPESGALAAPRPAKRLKSAPPSPSKSRDTSDQAVPPPSPRKGHEETREESALRDVKPDEFWERMAFRQECSDGHVAGFFVVAFLHRHDVELVASSIISTLPGQVAQAVLARITSCLLDLDFGGLDRAYRASAVLEELIRVQCGRPAMDVAIPEEKEALNAETTNGAADTTNVQHADGGIDSYVSYISGTITLSNPPLPPRVAVDNATVAPVVNVLQAKKKKRAV